MSSPGKGTGPEILLKVLPHAGDLVPPAYATRHSVGMDIAAAIMDEIVIEPGQTVLIPAGFMLAVPDGFEAQIRPRSGLALKHGITLPNSPGTVDPDYRGEIKVILLNLGPEPFTVTRGMRIAQLVIVPAVQATVTVVKDLPSTDRGEGGFGHSGT